MRQGFDFSTPEIFDWELEAVHQALMRQEIIVTKHAFDAADEENIPYTAILEAVLVGLAVDKDLPHNSLGRKSGINFEHLLDGGRWIRVKVSWNGAYFVVTVHTV